MSDQALPAEVAPVSGPRFGSADGIRGLASIGVLTAHIAILLPHTNYVASPLVAAYVGLGVHGLTMFFVLSGFLLYRPFAAAIIDGRALPAVKSFARNRFLRIWPAYIVVFCLAAFVFGTTLTTPAEGGHLDPIADRVGYLTSPLLIVLNLTLTQGFVPAGVFTGLGLSWSLVAEVGFYILLPVLGWLGVKAARRLGGSKGAVLPCVLLLVVGIVSRTISGIWVYSDGADQVTRNQSGETWSAVLFRSVFTMSDLLAIGMLVAVASVMVTRSDGSAWSLKRTRRFAGVATAIAMFVALVAYGTGDDRLTSTPMGVGLGGILALLVLPGASRVFNAFSNFLESPIPRWLGQCSYSTYLIHMSVCLFILVHFPSLTYNSTGGLLLAFLIVSAITLPLAALSYRFVEYPALKRKSRPVEVPAESARTAN